MKNTSIVLHARHLNWLERYGNPTSAQVREDLDMLLELLAIGIEEVTGVFTADEALLLCDVINGYDVIKDPNALMRYVRIVCDLALVDKVESMSPLARVTCIHLARNFLTRKKQDRKTAAVVFRTVDRDR